MESRNGAVNAWRVAAASVQGSGHRKERLECQDAHCWAEMADGRLIVAVADGAGSAPLGLDGARAASRAAVEAVQAEFNLPRLALHPDADRIALRQALAAARAAVAAAAEAHSADIESLAATLIVLIAAPDCLLAAQVGDGAIVAQDQQGSLFALTRPQNGEYVNTTVFLTTPSAVEAAAFAAYFGPVTHFAVFSDGLQRCALQMTDGTPFAPFFAPLFQFVSEESNPDTANRQLNAFLRSARVSERTEDDLTLVLAAHGPF